LHFVGASNAAFGRFLLLSDETSWNFLLFFTRDDVTVANLMGIASLLSSRVFIASLSS